VKLLSWNLAGRLRHIPQQVEMLASRTPDLVALQEVTQPGLLLLRTLLANDGLIHQADSFELIPSPALLTGPRRYGQLIASRFPIYAWEPGRFHVPWPERILSVDLETSLGSLEVHTTHIPPRVTNGWIKIEMLEVCILWCIRESSIRIWTLYGSSSFLVSHRHIDTRVELDVLRT
jgi:endonuclease/exonuclease/phosphatase family metal-dependent hydrolase